MFHLLSHRPSRTSRRRRGTILLFVVAVLTLLAVIGTAYIVMARNDKTGVRAGSESQNFEQAQEGVLNQVRGIMYDYAIDSQGQLLGYDTTGTNGKQARFFDYPETGATFGVSSAYPSSFMPDEPWLCQGLYPVTGTDVTQLAPARFDPSLGRLNPDPAFAATYTDAIGPASANLAAMTNPPSSPHLAPNAMYYLLPFSSPSGAHYRVALRIIDTNRMANLNTANPDAASAATDVSGQYLSSYSLGYALAGVSPLIVTGDNAPNLQNDPLAGRVGTLTPSLVTGTSSFNSLWQQQILTLENTGRSGAQPFDLTDELGLRANGNYGTSYIPRPQLVLSNTLLAYQGAGDSRGTPPGNLATLPRGNLTAWSFDRNFRPYPDPTISATISQYTLTPDAASLPPGPPTWAASMNSVWPTAPRKVAANPTLDTRPTGGVYRNGLFAEAKAATNIATAMKALGNATYSFTDNEIVAFAANYLTARSSGKMVTANGVSMYSTYNTASSPLIPQPTLSFIDNQGICIRSPNLASQGSIQMAQYASATDLNTSQLPGTPIVFGYAAQPFITEVAAIISKKTATTIQYNACAVELYNPYPFALDLTGWQLVAATTTNLVGVLPKGIPANSYVVVVYNLASTLIPVSADKVVSSSLLFGTTAGSTVTLTRPYWTRAGPLAPAGALATTVVDSFPVGQFAINPPPVSATTLSYQRAILDGAGTRNPWLYALPATHSDGSPLVHGDSVAQTLGQDNTPVALVAAANAIRLYDRFVDADQPAPAPTPGSQLLNIADFNRIPRIANDSSTFGTIGAKLQAICTGTVPAPAAAALASSAFKIEGQVYFDFLAVPSYYSSQSPMTAAPPAGNGDPRAITLLDYIAMIDRASDNSIDLGFGTNDINKVRLPGRINVNTAAPAVIRGAIPVSATLPEATADKIIADICGYRARFAPSGADFRFNGVAPDSFPPTIPLVGLGIRSLAELYFPVSTAIGTQTSLGARDQAWGKIFNYATTRSDTFAVYGIIEAVSANPNAGHNNGSDWYDVNNAKQTVLYRRRFIALIDRGFANYARIIPAGQPNAGQPNPLFSLPRVVAFKELPY